MSSRLIFRNLPATLELAAFKTHLAQLDAIVTDVKLVSKRRFAFVGYLSEEQAIKAKEWFDGTFLGSGKIKVDTVDDQTLANKQGKSAAFGQPMSQPIPSSSQPKKKTNKAFEEFAKVMKGNKEVLQNEEDQALESKAKSPEIESGVVDVVQVEEELDDAEWLRRKQAASAGISEEGGVISNENSISQQSPEESLILQTHRLFLRNLSFHTTSDTLRQVLAPFGAISEIHLPTSKTSGEPLGTAFVKFENGSDAVRVWREMDGRTVMGRLVHILPGRGKSGETQSSSAPNGGIAGVEGANEGGLFGKVLGKEDGVKVKAEVDKRRKEESNRGLNWGTLYMNSDAVASSVADRMGISKAEILNSESLLDGDGEKGVNSAVKLALAETSVINETKKYFETHGVLLAKLESTSDVPQGGKGAKRVFTPRSKTILLVKNIPFGTTLQVLRALFEPFGTLKRALMPPAGTLAVVEFDEEDDCFKAFKGVSYKRLGNAVIYLEKAPEGLLTDVGDIEEEEVEEKEVDSAEEALKRVEAATTQMESTDSPDEAESTLYIKNLSFATTTERMTAVFSSLPSFSFARVSTKPDPKNANGRLSMGFGFIGFKTKVAGENALRGLKGFKLDGHELEVKFAQRDRDEEESKDKKGGEGKKGKTTKMIVKNIPFEASKKDIRDLFSAYGTLKSCRIPKKHNSTGRGFAFLDFTTRAEAEAAMDALKHTHLLGRHLVLEWAAEEDFAGQEVERLREKAKREFVGEGEGQRKKRKLGVRDGKDVGGDDE